MSRLKVMMLENVHLLYLSTRSTFCWIEHEQECHSAETQWNAAKHLTIQRCSSGF